MRSLPTYLKLYWSIEEGSSAKGFTRQILEIFGVTVKVIEHRKQEDLSYRAPAHQGEIRNAVILALPECHAY